MLDSEIGSIVWMITFMCFGVFLMPARIYIVRRLIRDHLEVFRKMDPHQIEEWGKPDERSLNTYIRSGAYRNDITGNFSKLITTYKYAEYTYLVVFIIFMTYFLLI